MFRKSGPGGGPKSAGRGARMRLIDGRWWRPSMTAAELAVPPTAPRGVRGGARPGGPASREVRSQAGLSRARRLRQSRAPEAAARPIQEGFKGPGGPTPEDTASKVYEAPEGLTLGDTSSEGSEAPEGLTPRNAASESRGAAGPKGLPPERIEGPTGSSRRRASGRAASRRRPQGPGAEEPEYGNADASEVATRTNTRKTKRPESENNVMSARTRKRDEESAVRARHRPPPDPEEL